MPPLQTTHLWPSDTISLISDAATLLGFVSSVWLALTLKGIKRKYQRLIMLTKYLPLVQRHCANLEILMAEYTASAVAIASEIGRIRGMLNSLLKEAEKAERSLIEDVLSSINSYRSSRSLASLQSIYERMITIEEQLGHSLDRAKLNG